MSTPWGQEPYGAGDQTSYGAEVTPYGSGPVDPYAGEPGPPVPAYNPYVNPGSWEPAQYLPRQSPPGLIIAGSIVGYVLALFMFVTGLFLLFFGSVIGSFSDTGDFTDGGAPLVLAGLGNWVGVALFTAGGVLASVRKPAGLYLILGGAGLVVVEAVCWIAVYPEGFVVFWAVLHVLLAAVPAGLVAIAPGNRAWLEGRPGSGPPPRPAGPQPFPTDQYGRPFGS